MASKDTDRQARANYKKKVEKLQVELYPTDEDIKKRLAERVEAGEPKATYIKSLIRDDIENDKEDTEKEGVYLIYTDSMDDASTIVGYCLSKAEADKYCEDHKSEYYNELTWELLEKL